MPCCRSRSSVDWDLGFGIWDFPVGGSRGCSPRRCHRPLSDCAGRDGVVWRRRLPLSAGLARSVHPGRFDARAAAGRRAAGDAAGRRRGTADGTRHDDRAELRREPAPGEARPAHHRRPPHARVARVAVLGQGTGAARRGARLPQVGEGGRRVSRVRRRPRVLPGDRGGPRLPAADERARPDRRRVVRSVPARHVRQARRLPGLPADRRVQDRRQPVHAEIVHAGAPRDDRVAQRRHVRAAGARHRVGAQEDRGRDAAAARPGPVPPGGRGAAGPRGRAGVRRPARRPCSGAAAERRDAAGGWHRLPARHGAVARRPAGVAHRAPTRSSSSCGGSAKTTASRPSSCAWTAPAARQSPPTSSGES